MKISQENVNQKCLKCNYEGKVYLKKITGSARFIIEWGIPMVFGIGISAFLFMQGYGSLFEKSIILQVGVIALLFGVLPIIIKNIFQRYQCPECNCIFDFYGELGKK